MAWRPSHYVATGTLAAAGLRLGRARCVARAAPAHGADDPRGQTPTWSTIARWGAPRPCRISWSAAASWGATATRCSPPPPTFPCGGCVPGLVFHFRRLQTDSVADRVTVRVSPERRVRLSRDDAGWRQVTEAIPWTVARMRVTGAIGTSLYEALDKAVPDRVLPAGERRSLAWAIAEVYDWQVDFTRDVHPGDQFRVLFERLESPEGEYRFGRMLAAEVHVARVPAYAFSFAADAAQPASFYDERGPLAQARLPPGAAPVPPRLERLRRALPPAAPRVAHA